MPGDRMSGDRGPGRPDAPLVSFQLLAYNQERYVRDAVRGALSQAYEPMEVILSDDASTDGTFEIMKEEADRYSGPHSVVLRRNPGNLGLAEHLNAVMAISRGRIIVVAAGDDVSLPERTPACVARLVERPGLVAVCCRTRTIDSEGAVRPEWGDLTRDHWEEPLPTRDGRIARYIECWRPMLLGCANAFRRDVVDRFGPFHADVVNEDVVFSFRAHLLGEIGIVETVGVHYRKHAESMSNNERVRMGAMDRAVARERSRTVTLRRRAGIWRMMASDLEGAAGDGRNGLRVEEHVRRIREQERLSALLARQPERSLLGRIGDLYAIARSRAPWGALRGSSFRVLPRPVVLGINALRTWVGAEVGRP